MDTGRSGPQSGRARRSEGEKARRRDESVEEAYASRRAWDAPQWQYDAWVSTYTAIRAGEVEAVTGDVQRITGHPPIGLRELLGTAPD